ncbi:hypothetical protein ACP4OV_021782 [Aristida adscensionis]
MSCSRNMSSLGHCRRRLALPILFFVVTIHLQSLPSCAAREFRAGTNPQAPLPVATAKIDGGGNKATGPQVPVHGGTTVGGGEGKGTDQKAACATPGGYYCSPGAPQVKKSPYPPRGRPPFVPPANEPGIIDRFKNGIRRILKKPPIIHISGESTQHSQKESPASSSFPRTP